MLLQRDGLSRLSLEELLEIRKGEILIFYNIGDLNLGLKDGTEVIVEDIRLMISRESKKKFYASLLGNSPAYSYILLSRINDPIKTLLDITPYDRPIVGLVDDGAIKFMVGNENKTRTLNYKYFAKRRKTSLL